MRILALLLCPALLLAQAQQTQMKPFRVSPSVSLTHDLGISSLKLEYARPAVKGRKVWGDLVPFGQVWRAGANSATVLTFSDPVRIAGKEVPAGSYALFALPGAESWTLILNKQAKQWGAYFYKQDEDVLRWRVKPRAIPHQEWLEFVVEPDGERAWDVELRWERVAVPFEVEVDVRGIYWKHLQDTLAKAKDTEWLPWFQAADYCFKQGIHPQESLAWGEKSLKAGESFWNQECLARILHKAGRTQEALPHLERAVELARGKAPKEWLEAVEKDILAWKAGPKPWGGPVSWNPGNSHDPQSPRPPSAVSSRDGPGRPDIPSVEPESGRVSNHRDHGGEGGFSPSGGEAAEDLGRLGALRPGLAGRGERSYHPPLRGCGEGQRAGRPSRQLRPLHDPGAGTLDPHSEQALAPIGSL
jgi:Protein of unknown function (DUF2911)